MGRMLSLTMNEAAAEALGVSDGRAGLTPPGGLAAGLRERLAVGIERRGAVLTWADSTGGADGAPSFFPDLTAWECSDSSFHLEDHVPVTVRTVDDAPVISPDDQRTLLRHGVALALEFRRLVAGLDRPGPVRCIVGANDTNATFRFHLIREGETWHAPDLDRYLSDKMVVVDLRPTGGS